jgi:exonuclease V gamma subunit
LDLAGYQIIGRIEGIYQDKLIHKLPTGLKCKYLLRLWLQQMIVQASGRNIIGSELFYLDNGLTKCCRLKAPEREVMDLLVDYLKIYLDAIRRPIPFFPECALIYLKKWKEFGDRSMALNAARKFWHQSFRSDVAWSNHEGDDVWIERCYRGREPIDDEFGKTSERIMEPLLAAME